jgi:hypothetical protein
MFVMTSNHEKTILKGKDKTCFIPYVQLQVFLEVHTRTILPFDWLKWFTRN